MTRALAIETSGRIGSVATVLDGHVTSERSFEHGLQNAAKILPIIDQLVVKQDWKPRDIDELYVSIGPGSFTGLRIGVTIAKTMALATGAKVVAVPSLRVLAENAPAEAKQVVIVLDAKRGQIYTARFERLGDSALQETEPAHLDRLVDVLARSPRPLHLLGEGIDYHRDAIDRHEAGLIVTDRSLWQAQARIVAGLGFEMARRDEFADVDRLTPIYIRLPEAEEKWNAARKSPVP